MGVAISLLRPSSVGNSCVSGVAGAIRQSYATQDMAGRPATMEPQSRELLTRWQQRLAQAMTEVEAMLRHRGMTEPRRVAAAGLGSRRGNRRRQGGAATPSAFDQGAGPAVFTEKDAAPPAANCLTEGNHPATTIHTGHE